MNHFCCVMKRKYELLRSYVSSLLCLCGLLVFLTSCGVVGPPIPPEDIGIEAKIRSQNKPKKTQNDGEEVVPIEEEPISLPPLQRVGSQ